MKILSAIVIGAMTGSVAWAQMPTFEGLDVDSDGLLSTLEAKGAPEVDFYDADANKDGGIDVEEYKIATTPSDE